MRIRSLALIGLLLTTACGGSGGNEDSVVGFTAGVFSGATDYRLRSSNGDDSLCDHGLNRLYREDPLGYSIEPTGTTNGVTSFTVTKLGKGFRSGEVLSTDSSLRYVEELNEGPLPDAAGISCVGKNTVALTVIDVDTIDADQILTFSCGDGNVTTDCVFDQNARLGRAR